MKLLITGASGYVGAGVLKCAPNAWQIAATYFANRTERDGVSAFRVDVRDAGAVNRLFEEFRPQVVIHTAALMTGAEMMATNADGTRHIARAAKQSGARLIHMSSDVIFDGEHAPYAENAMPAPITPYAESKARAEEIVRNEYLTPVIVRTSLVYGFDPMDPRTRQTLAGEMPHLFTDEYRCPIFVDDLANALIELAQNNFAGVIHIAGAQRVSRYDFGLKLAQAFHVEPKFTPAVSAASPIPRPRDCTLNISLAQQVLRTRLRGVDKVMQRMANG
jgi:dTDP-4-dehydrorhamnose reductase